jgi:hypothetical protein
MNEYEFIVHFAIQRWHQGRLGKLFIPKSPPKLRKITRQPRKNQAKINTRKDSPEKNVIYGGKR